MTHGHRKNHRSRGVATLFVLLLATLVFVIVGMGISAGNALRESNRRLLNDMQTRAAGMQQVRQEHTP